MQRTTLSSTAVPDLIAACSCKTIGGNVKEHRANTPIAGKVELGHVFLACLLAQTKTLNKATIYTVTTMLNTSPPPPDIKTEQLGLRITPTAKALLKVAALREHRSASNMVEHLILDYCERNNIVLSPNQPSNQG